MAESEKSAVLDPNLSRRLHRALTAGKDTLFQIMEDPDLEVIRAALKNPALDENHLLALLQRRDLTEDLIQKLYRHELAAGSHNLKVAVVRNPNTPGQIVLTLLPHLYLFELLTICHLPGATPDQKIAAERAIIQRLPATPLGNKITLARRGTSGLLETLMRDGDPRIVEACLMNPRLKEPAIFQFLGSARATAETISMVARHPRWSARLNLRLAILKNHHTPAIWFTLWLPNLGSNDMKNLIASRRLGSSQKLLVEEELRRRGQRIAAR